MVRVIPFLLHKMEDTINEEQLSLINELIQGKELAKQLCNHLVSSSSPSPSSHETKEFLVEKVISAYTKAVTVLNWESNVWEINTTNSHCSSTNGSPRNEVMTKNSSTNMPSRKGNVRSYQVLVSLWIVKGWRLVIWFQFLWICGVQKDHAQKDGASEDLL